MATYLISCWFFFPVCSTASPSPCYPTAAAASNTAKGAEWTVPAQEKKNSAKKEGAMGERGGLGSSRKLQKCGAACCVLGLSSKGRKILHTDTNGSHGDIHVFSVCVVKVRMALYGYKNPSPAQKIALQNLFLFPTGLKTMNRMCILTCSL